MTDCVHFTITPNSISLGKVREKTNWFFKSHGLSEKSVKEQMMILDELVQIGLNLRDTASSKNKIRVRINIDNNAIQTKVSTPIGAKDTKQLENLDKTIQFVMGFQDPFEAYQEMNTAKVSKNLNGINGLSVAKIAYKGKATVDFFVNNNRMLNLYAIRSIGNDYQN